MKKLLLILTACFVFLVSCTAAGKWQAQYDLGVRYLNDGNYAEAIIAFTAAIEIDEKNVEAYLGRADAYIASGETEVNLTLAFADYEAVITIDSTVAEAYIGMADIYVIREEYEEATKAYDEAVKLGSGESELYIKAAEAHAKLEDSKEHMLSAVEYYIKAAEGGELSDDKYADMAKVYLKYEDGFSAFDMLEKLPEKARDLVIAEYTERARICEETSKDFGTALKYYNLGLLHISAQVINNSEYLSGAFELICKKDDNVTAFATLNGNLPAELKKENKISAIIKSAYSALIEWLCEEDKAEVAFIVLEQAYREGVFNKTENDEFSAKICIAIAGEYIKLGDTANNLIVAEDYYMSAFAQGGDNIKSKAILGIVDVYIRRGEDKKALDFLKSIPEQYMSVELKNKLREMNDGEFKDSSGRTRRIYHGGIQFGICIEYVYDDAGNIIDNRIVYK